MAEVNMTKDSGYVSKDQPPTVIVPNVVPYRNPAGEEYPIIAYNNYVLPNGNNASVAEVQELLQSVRDCGFNVNLWACSAPENQNVLKKNFQIAESLGLSTILNVGGLMPYAYHDASGDVYYKPPLTSLDYVLNLYKGIGNLWGYMLMDEPVFLNWGYETTVPPDGMVDLLVAFKTYNDNSNGHVAFFNLAVSIGKVWIGDKIANLPATTTAKMKYTMYLREIQRKFNPSMLTVDIYPISVDENIHDFKIRDEYYYSLEAIGDFSAQYALPIWMFMLSNQHTLYFYKTDGSFDHKHEYPFPSKEMLRFQAMNALAFGFQGIVFWTYSMGNSSYIDDRSSYIKGECVLTNISENKYRCSSSSEYEITRKPSTEYYYAPYVNGHPTEVWNNCKSVIAEIKKFGNILLGSWFQKACHVYGQLSPDPNPYPCTTAFKSPFECVVGASGSNWGFVMTQLKKGSVNFLAIVNHNPYNKQDISLTISSGYKFQQIRNVAYYDSCYDSSEQIENKLVGTNRSITRELGPGGMLLFSYEKIQ